MRGTGRKKKKTQRRMRAAQKRRLVLLAGLVLVCVLFVLGVSYSSVYRYVHKMRPNQIEQNVFVQGVDVSGLTKTQAEKKLRQAWKEIQETLLILKDGDHKAAVTVKELGIGQGNVEAEIEKAVNYAKKGSLFSRYRKIRAAKREKVEYHAEYEIDDENIQEILRKKTEDFYEEAVDATISRVSGVFQITEEQEGEKLDLDAAVKELDSRLPELLSGKEVTVEVKAEKDEPQITKKDLEEIEDELGKFESETDQEEQGLISQAAGILNGQIIMPGKEFSLKKTLESVLKSFEEKYPDEFSHTASTVYMAALEAELDITEREQLDQEADYAEPGMDAALQPDKDLKMKNEQDDPVYMEVYLNQKNELVCRIYGKETRSKARNLSFESEVLEKEEPVTEYIADDELDAGTMKKTSDGARKIKSRLWKITEEQGKATVREEVNTTEYKGKNKTILVGTKSDDEATVEKLEKAIESQDKKKIEKAIKEVNGEAET